MILFSRQPLLDPRFEAIRAFGSDDDDRRPRSNETHAFRCRWCSERTESLDGRLLQWCPTCRTVYLGSQRRYLCHLPRTWSPHAFCRYCRRGYSAAASASSDMAFTRFVCERLGLEFELALGMLEAARSDPTFLGELALQHKLLSRAEVKWMAAVHRSAPANRRLSFGEIGIRLGLWTEELLAPLTAAQAERTRGLVPTLARQAGIKSTRILEAERDFFGLYPTRAGWSSSPVSILMAA